MNYFTKLISRTCLIESHQNSILLLNYRKATVLTALVMLFSANFVFSQINYSQNFSGCSTSPCNNWSISGGLADFSATPSNGFSPCAVSDVAARTNLNGTFPMGILAPTASLGMSTGELMNFGFKYKCINFTSGVATPASSCTFNVEYSNSAVGPWTLIQSFQNGASSSCTSFTSNYFFPTVGQPVFVRVRAERTTGDYWVVLDDITLNQPSISVVESTACSCNNDQTPNNTNGTYNTTLKIKYADNTPIPSGLNYSIVSSTGLSNAMGGPLGTPAFNYCNGTGCPAGVSNGQYYLNVRVTNQVSGAYTAMVDGPDPDNASDYTLSTSCSTLYPMVPVIPLNDVNCLNAGINTFSSSSGVYSNTNSITNPMLADGFSQMGTGDLLIDNDLVNEADNNPVYTLFLNKEVGGCRVTSMKDFRVYRQVVADLINTSSNCRTLRSNDSLSLTIMLAQTNTGGGSFSIPGVTIVNGRIGVNGPACYNVTYSVTDSCGVVRSDTKSLQITVKPSPSFNFDNAPGEPVSPTCSANPVQVNLIRTSTGQNPNYLLSSNNPSYTPTRSGNTLTLPAPPIGQSVRYTICLVETNNTASMCGTITVPTACADTLCKNFVVYRDKSDCGANQLFSPTCADFKADLCPAFATPAINIGCSFFSINTPDLLEAKVIFNDGIHNCDDPTISGSYEVSFVGLDAGTAAGGPTIGSLPGISVVCSIFNFKILGWRPLGALYNILGCGKSLVQAIFDLIATIAGGSGGGYLVMADTDGDGGFDHIIANKGGDDSVFPDLGDFTIPNRVKGNGYVSVRAVCGWVNKPSSVCGNFDIEALNILDRFPIGAIPVVGAVVEALLNAGNCGINVALSGEKTESVKVINNSTPEFLNCNPSGYVFAQTLDCNIPVNWSVPTAKDGCSDNTLVYMGPVTPAYTTNYSGTTPPTLVTINGPGVYQTEGPVPGSVLTPGIYPVTYTAVSCNGLPVLCSFNVVVTSGNPILEAPNDITINTDANLCSTIVNGLVPYQGVGCSSIINYSYTSPVTNTVVQTNSTTSGTHNIPDGRVFELGTTLITYTMLVDINGDGDYNDPGETQTDTFRVVVVDNERPHAVCLDVEVQLNNLGAATVYATQLANQIYIDAGSTDNCSISSILISKNNVDYFSSLSFDCADKGQNVINMRVTDGSGNISYCKAVIKVLDFFEGFKLDLDVPEVCFEPFQNVYDFSKYIVIATPTGPNISHANVSTLGPEVVGSFGISSFLPDPGSTNDPGTMTTDGIYTLGTGTGWITFSYILSINEQVNQINDTSPLTGCFRMVHDIFRVEKLDPIWKGGYMCCDQLPVWLGGASWDGNGPAPVLPGMLSLTDIRGAYPGDVYGEWTGQGVSFKNPDGIAFSGDEFYQFDPNGLDGTYTLIYTIGDEPCIFTYAQDIRVTCQDLHIELSDITVCPANWVEERVVIVNLDDKDEEISVSGFNEIGADGGHYGNNVPVANLVGVPVVDGRIVIPGFYAPAVRNKTYEICVTTYQTTPFGCTDVFCYDITVQDLESPIFHNCPKDPIIVDAPIGWCSSFVNFEYPWANDNCMGLYSKVMQVDQTGFKSGSLFPVGLTILSYTAIDTVGNQSYCELKIIVNDFHTPPSITCPANVEKPNDLDKCGAIVNNIAPVEIKDNCIDNVTVQYEITDATGKSIGCGFEDASGDFFPVGTSTVKYKITDQPLILITEVVQNGVIAGMEITNFGPAAVDITCAKFIVKNAAGVALETFVLPSNNNISTMFERPIYPPVIPVLWNVRNPDNILQVGETFTHIFNGDQDGDGDVDVTPNIQKCDQLRYCFAFLDRVIDEAWINGQVDGEVILRKNECDHDIQTDFIPATPCDPGSFGMLNPGLTTMTPNGTLTALQSVAPSMKMCTFTVKVNDVEAPTCIKHDTIPMITTAFPLAVPVNIVAQQCLKATVVMPAGIVDDVNIRNLKVTISNAGAVTAYLRAPSGKRIKLFSRVCALDTDVCDGDGLDGNPNIDINLDETIKWVPAPSVLNAVCTPSMGNGGTYRPEESFKEFYGEPGGGTWTLEMFTDEGVTGTLTDWDLQILYRKVYDQPNVTLENALGLCTQDFTWIHPIFEDNCCKGQVDITYTFKNVVTGEMSVEKAVITNPSGTIKMEGCTITKTFKVGVTTIEYALKDQYGNESVCGFIVTVLDTEKPVFVAPGCPDRVINLAPSICYGVLINPPSATDNCKMDTVTFCFADGSPADINKLPIGVYNLTAKAVDIYGNLQTCVFQVSVIEYIPTNIPYVCNDLLNISLDENCEAVITASMILQGSDYRCLENYCITITTLAGLPHANLFTLADVDKTFIVSISDCLVSGNSCWGYVKIEQKIAPSIECPGDVTVYCGEDTSPEKTGFALLRSCEPFATIYHVDYVENFGQCAKVRTLIKRTWYIDDNQGNVVNCIQFIDIIPIVLEDIKWPKDIEIDNPLQCGDVIKNPELTTPANTGYPTIGGKTLLLGNQCMISIIKNDEIFPLCGGAYVIARTWKILNACKPLDATNPAIRIQAIKVLDTQGPAMYPCPSDTIVSTSPWTCFTAVITLPIPAKLEDLCGNVTLQANIYGGGTIEVTGSKELGTLKVKAYNLAKGNHTVRYRALDGCGNVSTCSFVITVVDKTPPVATAKRDIVLGLTTSTDINGVQDGQAKLFAASLNNGSFDNCTNVRLEVRRPRGSSCGNNGKLIASSGALHNNNLTFNDKFTTTDYSVNDTDGGEFVKFCCEDLTSVTVDANGDGAVDSLDRGYHEVILRVWDDGNMNGIIGDAGDNYNDTWSFVKVESKVPPVITCPADATIYCDWAIPTSTTLVSTKNVDFTKTGLATAYSTCGNPEIFFKDVLTLDQCGIGTILRTFSITHNGISRQCTQKILVLNSTSAQQWVITVPTSEIDATTCVGPSAEQIKSKGPKWVGGPCDVIGVNTKVTQFDFEDGVCKKWQVEYNLTNWCNNEVRGPYYKFFMYRDEVIPEFAECRDTMYAVDANCELKGLKLTKKATDLGGCTENGWLKWTVFIDLWGDGTDDYEFTSFLPVGNDVANAASGNIAAIKDDNGNGVKDIYVAPTLNGGTVSITIPESIVGKMSNHKVSWKVTDGCHNFATCHESFMVADKKAPTPVCVPLSTALMADPDGAGPFRPMVELWAVDFNASSTDNCTAEDKLLYTFDNVLMRVKDTLIQGRLVNWDVAHYFNTTGGLAAFPARETNAAEKAIRDKYLRGEDGIQLWNPLTRSSAKVWTDVHLVGGVAYADVEVKMSVWDTKFNVDFCLTQVKLICATCPGTIVSTITGNALTEQSKVVKEVSITATSVIPEFPRAKMTDSMGTYTFTFLNDFDYKLNASKEGSYVDGVSTIDLVMIQRHILGLELFNSPYKVIAADANNSSKVTAADLTELRKLILGIYEELPSSASWRFPIKNQVLDIDNPFPYEETIYVDSLHTNLVNQSFVAVKIGDVNGSYVSGFNSGIVAPRNIMKFNILDREIEKGEKVSIEIKANDANDLFGMQAQLEMANLRLMSMKPGKIEFLNDEVRSMSESSFRFSKAIPSGVNMIEGDVLFTIEVEALQSGLLSDMMKLGSAIVPEAYIGSSLETRNVQFGWTGAEADIEFVNLSPNPWYNVTNLSFDVQKRGQVSLEITDYSGKLVKNVSSFYEAGRQTIQLNRTELSQGGVYIYELKFADRVVRGKMIMLQ